MFFFNQLINKLGCNYKMAIYLQYDGIKGNVTADGYKDHIAIFSAKLNISRGISMVAGNMANRESTRPKISEVLLVKLTDNSTTGLFKESVTGNAGKKVEIKFVSTGANKVEEYMSYILENCLVSEYAFNTGADGQPVERIKLSYSKILINYSDFDVTNKSSSPQRVGYDLEMAKPL
jgi:type VI secretion system secreted protein Hcp